jgi:hypothetical protein
MPQKWEYRIFTERREALEHVQLTELLNALGDQGWEAVGVVQAMGGHLHGAGPSVHGELYAKGLMVLLKRPKA